MVVVVVVAVVVGVVRGSKVLEVVIFEGVVMQEMQFASVEW